MLAFWMASSFLILIGGFALVWVKVKAITVGDLVGIPLLAIGGPVTIFLMLLGVVINFWSFKVIESHPKPIIKNDQ